MPSPDPSGVKAYLTVAQAARVLGLNPVTIRRWIWAGKLAIMQHPSGRIRIPREAIQQIQCTGVYSRRQSR